MLHLKNKSNDAPTLEAPAWKGLLGEANTGPPQPEMWTQFIFKCQEAYHGVQHWGGKIEMLQENKNG